MPQGNPKPGELYLHFKKKLYQVITIAEHSETQEALVVYQALYGTFKTYARPLEMFTSPVDTEKYPNAAQTYRFQLVEPDAVPAESAPITDAPDVLQIQNQGAFFSAVPNAPNTNISDIAQIQAQGTLSSAATNTPITDVPDMAQTQGTLSPAATNTPAESSAEEKLMAFFDAETMDEKYKILLEMRNDITDRMINNMAVVLDVVIDEGPLDYRYEELKTCVRTFRRYETSRLR